MIWRDMSYLHAKSMMALYDLFKERGVEFVDGTMLGDALVSRAQSITASMFYRSDCDVMFTCGSDTIFNAEEVYNMLERCSTGPDYDILGAVVMKRWHAPTPACTIPVGDMIMDDEQWPVETKYMGTGVCATHRRVFDALAPKLPLCAQSDDNPFYPFYMPMVVPEPGPGVFNYLSEDYALVVRARGQGFKCWIDPRVRPIHLTTVGMRLEDMLREPTPEAMPMMLRGFADGSIEIRVPSEMAVEPAGV